MNVVCVCVCTIMSNILRTLKRVQYQHNAALNASSI